MASVSVDIANSNAHQYELYWGQFDLSRIPGLSADQVAQKLATDLALHILLLEDVQKLLKPGPTSNRDKCHWSECIRSSFQELLFSQLRTLKVPVKIYKDNPDAVIKMHQR